MMNLAGENKENILRSPQFIHEFQSFFGVQKLKISKKYDDKKWISVRGAGTAGPKDHILTNGSTFQDGETKHEKNIVYYQINSKFWYYLFLFGTQLGEEPFCALFFSLWFWNLDASIGRRLVLVWNLIMYIGQYLKDFIRWERPGMPIVVQLQTKWSLEYGMPSTHAMLGVAVPGAALWFTVAKFNIDTEVALGVISVWTLLVCTSRMYLGMHSLGDILAGLLISVLLLAPVLYLVNVTDVFLVQSPLAPPIVLVLSILLIWAFPYPESDFWSPSAVTTVDVLGCYHGAHLGQWTMFSLGLIKMIHHPELSTDIMMPDMKQTGLMLVRVIIGGLTAAVVRMVVKPRLQKLAENISPSSSKKEFSQKNKYTTSMIMGKFMTWSCVCFSMTCISPIIFMVLGIERESFYLENVLI